MGSLRDEAYEKLDYLSQLTEVVVGPQNEILARVPDRIELSYETIAKAKIYTWNRAGAFELNVVGVLQQHVGEVNHRYLEQIKNNFVFEISPEFEINFEEQTVVGTIALVKHTSHLEEKKLLELAVARGLAFIDSYSWPSKKLRDRAVVVLNTLEDGKGSEWVKGVEGRVYRQAGDAITTVFRQLIMDNKWRIRDATVIEKMGKWINEYMLDQPENLGLVNLMKLKIMLSKDLPVYSIDEVKHVNPAGTP